MYCKVLSKRYIFALSTKNKIKKQNQKTKSKKKKKIQS